MFIAGPAGPALADPPLTLDEAKTQVSKLETEASAIDQEYAGVKEQVRKGEAALGTKASDVKAQTAKVAQMKVQVGQVALAQFQNRNIDTTAQLFFTEDTSGFLSQISTVEKVSENQNTVLQSFQREQAGLADLQRSTETDLANLKAKKVQLKELRKASDKKVEESKAVLSRLTEVERKRLEAEEAEKAAAAQQAAESSGDTKSSSTSNSGNSNSGDSSADQSSADKSSADKSSADKSSADKSSADKSSADKSSADKSSADDSNADDSSKSDRSSRASRSGDRQSTSSGSSKGQSAMAFARNQIGKPYSFGATGPGSYDCSGLTGAAWRAAGVSLSRTSQSQISDGTAVSKSDLQPGDLVFYYSGITHVALYAGNGQILHAPRPGKSVEYAGVDSMPFAGARRPG